MPVPRLLGISLVLATALTGAGCGSLGGDASVPGLGGGLPPDAPPRAAAQAPYPHVHDVPPPRETKLISVSEQERIEAELAANRRKANAQAEALQKERIGTDR